MFETARKEASDPTTPAETLSQLSLFVGLILGALRQCAQKKLELGIPTQNIVIGNVTHNEARYCRSFLLNAHLWGEILLNRATEKDELMSLPWAEEPLLELFTHETPTPRLGVFEAALTDVLHLLAQNPAAPPVLLKKLFGVAQTKVREAVAENPNAPIIELFSQNFNTGLQPENVLRNPAFPLMLVERPDFFRIIPQWLAIDFLRAPSCSVDMLQAFVEHPDGTVQVAIAEHGLVTAELLEQLSRSSDVRVRGSVAKHSQTPAPILLKLSKDHDYSVQKQIAKNPQTPIEGLEHLAKFAFYNTKEELAQNPASTADILHILAQDKSLSLLRMLLEHANVSARTLHVLAQDRRKALLLLVAKHPKLSQETVTHLAQNTHVPIKRSLLKNPATPQAIAQKISKEISSK